MEEIVINYEKPIIALDKEPNNSLDEFHFNNLINEINVTVIDEQYIINTEVEEKVEEEKVEEVKVEDGVKEEEKVEEIKIEDGEKEEEVKFEEVKVEEEVKVQEIDKFDFTNKSIIHILLYLVDNKDINEEEIEKYYKKVSVSLSKEECNLIKTLIYKNNIVFSEIENIIIDSLEKNKLDTHQIILIIQIFYERLHNYKYNIKNKTNICSQILKFIIHTIVIEKQFINISLEEIKEIDKIINSCITLLAFPKIIKEKKCCSLM